MATLWLIRHGETDWNVAGRLQGQLDVPLNANGRVQAAKLSQRLGGDHAREPFGALYTSDLGRARETAEASSRVLGLELKTHVGLRERHFGVLSELTLSEAEARHPGLYARLKVRDADFVPEGGESLAQVFARSLRVLNQIADEHPGKHVLVITHGGVLDSAWRAAKGVALQVKRDHELHNTGIYRVRVQDGRFEVAGWGE